MLRKPLGAQTVNEMTSGAFLFSLSMHLCY